MRTVLLALFVALLPLAGMAETTIKASWDANAETNVMGYRVLTGPSSRTYTGTNTVLGRMNNTMLLTNLPPGVTFIAVIAFTTDPALDSGFSNEVAWTNRTSAPVNFRVLRTITLDP